MAIRQTAVSYYGLGYAEHAAADFREMREHGCTTVILAIQEFEMDFWFPNLGAIIGAAKKEGLRVLLDPGGSASILAASRSACFCKTTFTTGRFPR